MIQFLFRCSRTDSKKTRPKDAARATSFFGYISVFYKLARGKFLILPSAMLMAGLFDTIGLVTFFPLLEQLNLDSSSSAVSAESRMLTGFMWALSAIGVTTISHLLFFMASVFVMKFFIIFGQRVLIQKIRNDLFISIARRITRGWGAADYARLYLNQTTGGVANILTSELWSFLGAFQQYIEIFVHAVYIMLYLTTAIFLDVKITVLAICAALLMAIVFRGLMRLTRIYSRALTRTRQQYQERIIEFMQSYKYLKATYRFPQVFTHLERVVIRMTSLRFRLGVIKDLLATVAEPFSIILVVFFLYLQLVVWDQRFALIAVLLLLFYRLVTTLVKFQMSWQKFFSATGSLEAVESSLESIDRLREPIGTTALSTAHGELVLERVSFSYGGSDVIHDMTMRFPSQQTVALVGASGAGKSTVVDLLTGVLKPTHGHVLFADQPYDAIDLQALRACIGYVTQEVVMFQASLLDNISFWDATSTRTAQVEQAARRASCDFIFSLPDRFNSPSGERGLKFSVGQRQRIAIARELYKEPSILIFDEATSALDSASERAIQESIDALHGEKTMILIAHRLSTIKHADYIYVLHEGRIVEEGAFADLYAHAESRFRSMCDLQQFL